MNTGSGQPDREPLTPEEREWAQRLSRLGPSAGPPSAIDARVLAAAHDAVAARPRAHDRHRRRWPVALGVAASLALAVGVAWRLRPLPEAPVLARGEAEIAADRAAGGPAPPPEPMMAPPAVVRMDTPPPPPPQEPKREALAKERDKDGLAAAASQGAPPVRDESRVADAAMAPAAAPPPPPPAPVAEAEAAASTAAANADMAAGAAAAQQESERMQKAADAVSAQRSRSLAAPAPAALPEASFGRDAQAQKQASDEQIEIVGSDDGDEPPAYANSPEVREAWLRRIRELIAEGDLQQAHDSLDEFERRYPGHALPDDLKRFEKTKHNLP